MRLSVNPVPFWRKAPAPVRVAASMIYASLLMFVGSIVAGAAPLFIADGTVGVIVTVVAGYLLVDSATVVLKGGRAGSVLSMLFAAAVLGFQGFQASQLSVVLLASAAVVLVGVGLLFTPAASAYRLNSDAFSAREMLAGRRGARGRQSAGGGEAAGAQPEAPMNRQQRRAAQRSRGNRGGRGSVSRGSQGR